MAVCHQHAFGLLVESHFQLPGMRSGESPRSPDIAMRLAGHAEIDRCWSGPSGPPLWQTVLDGRPFGLEAGRLGDHLMTYGGDRFLLHNPAGTLMCAVADAGDPAWQRQLLDTVLHCISSLRGFELLHASAVQLDGGVVAFAALSGGGKTSLAAELLSRGASLFADDVLAFGRAGNRIVAHPGPPVMNLPTSHVAGDQLGLRIATFPDDDEAWVEIDRFSAEPCIPAAVYLLERRPATETGVIPLSPNPLHLMRHSIGIRSRKERYRARFELFADVAAGTPLYSLRADSAVAVDRLADLVEESLQAPAATAGVA